MLLVWEYGWGVGYGCWVGYVGIGGIGDCCVIGRLLVMICDIGYGLV